MSLKKMNESFSRLCENTKSVVASQDTGLKALLTETIHRIRLKGGNNINDYGTALQEAIEKYYPDQSWWEVTNVDIAGRLFETRSPELTIDEIVSDVENKEALKEASSNVYIWNGIDEVPRDVVRVKIEKGVTNIGEEAFSDCTSLTAVTIPDSVTSIGDVAFYNCTTLTEVTIPDSVTSIGNWAFYNCTALTSVTIPDSVTSIGKAAFRWCRSLTNVTIPDSMVNRHAEIFKDCDNLKTITTTSGKTIMNESYRSKYITALKEALRRLNEDAMSDEDRADSELIRSMIRKLQARSNAAFTPQEKAVMDKYGITRNNHWKTLSVDGRALNRRIDDESRSGSRYSKGFSNGTESKINYADRARKLPQRKDSQIGPITYDNDDINSHGGVYTGFSGLTDAERHAQDIPMRDKMRNMKDALWNRNYEQSRIDNADAARAKRMSAAQAAFDKAKAEADKWYKWDTVDATKNRDRAQAEIDTLLKRQRESYRRKRLKESSTECSGTHFRVSYDSNGTPSAVMVKADTEQAAKDTYMKLKGAKYPKVYGVTKMSDYEVRDYKKRGMSCLN